MREILSHRSLRFFVFAFVLSVCLWQSAPSTALAETASPPKLLEGDSVGLALFDRKVSLRLEPGPGKIGEKLALVVESGKFSRLNVFELSSPRRMVIDLYGKTPPRVREYSTPESRALSRVRIGTHSDRLRIVADFRKDFPHSAEWNIVSNVLEIDFPEDTPATNDANDTFGLISNEQPEILEVSSVTQSVMPEIEETQVVKAEQSSRPVLLNVRRINKKPVVTEVAEDIIPLLEEPIQAAQLPELERAALQIPEQRLEPIVPTSQEALNAIHQDNLIEQNIQIDTNSLETDLLPTPVEPALDAASKEEQDARASLQLSVEEEVTEEPDQTNAEPTIESSLIVEEPVKPVQALQTIEFDYHAENRAPLVKFNLTERPRFTLVRKSPELFSISIPQCELQGKGVNLPYFPPHDFHGFLMIKARKEQKDTQIEITVDRGTQLTSYVRENSIYLRATAPARKG